MSRRKRKSLEIFSLSFLDCICCGFGAIILMFVLTTGRGIKVNERKISVASEQVRALEAEIEAEQQALAQAQAELASAREAAAARAQAADVTSRLLAELQQRRADFKQLETVLTQRMDELSRLSALKVPTPDKPPKAQNLGGFDLSGRRVIFLLEASGGMLAESVPQALDRLKLPKAERLASPKWKRAKLATSTLIRHLEASVKYQVYAYNNACVYIGDYNGRWLAANSEADALQVADGLDKLEPAGGANLEKALSLMRDKGADHIVLITDGLPTRANSVLAQYSVSQADRIRMLAAAKNVLPRSIKVSSVLLPMAGDPAAAPYYWRFALDTGGQLISPAKRWP